MLAGDRSFHYLYWPMVDTVAHTYGPLSPPYYRELDFVDLMVQQVAVCCANAGATLIFTADHGQALLAEQRAVIINSECATALKRPPGGNRRALYLSEKELGEMRHEPLLQQEDLVLVGNRGCDKPRLVRWPRSRQSFGVGRPDRDGNGRPAVAVRLRRWDRYLRRCPRQLDRG